MGPVMITSAWLPGCRLWPMLAAPGWHGSWVTCAALGPDCRKAWPHQRWRGGRGIFFYCQPPPVLPSPTSSWYQTTLRLTDSIYLSLGSKSGHKAMCASDSPRWCNDDTTISETGSLWTGESSLPHMMLWWSCLPKKSYSNVFLIPLLPRI